MAWVHKDKQTSPTEKGKPYEQQPPQQKGTFREPGLGSVSASGLALAPGQESISRRSELGVGIQWNVPADVEYGALLDERQVRACDK